MMTFANLADFIAQAPKILIKGPVALIMAEDEVEIGSTIRHHLDVGFHKVVVFADAEIVIPPELGDKILRVTYDLTSPHAVPKAINALNDRVPNLWMFYCYNAEYLFFPFCEHRTVGEMLAFHAEERRDSMLTYVIDLYAGKLGRYPNAVSLDEAMLDKSGYYALARPDKSNDGHPTERQLDYYGGLRWRFEEHIPQARRRIDRISIFRSKKGLRLSEDHTFNDAEYNTYSCPWHHNLTASVCSFRTAKALKRNPGSTFSINSFEWRNSTRFEWHSQQLLDLGLMEPGQWF